MDAWQIAYVIGGRRRCSKKWITVVLSALLMLTCPIVVVAQTESKETTAPSDPVSAGGSDQISADEAMVLGETPIVYSAAKYEQKVNEAPASVTIITGDQIKKYGYRTFVQVLQSVPGLFATYDRTYDYLGVRGFNRPGDYNGRVLLLVDGHRLNDAIFDQAPIGTDSPIDVDLIERVEVVRGPGSSLYGTNAFFGTINVITKRGRDIKGTEASWENSSYTSNKGRLTYGNKLSNGLEFIMSGSYYYSVGQENLFYPEFNTPATNNGIAHRMDQDTFHNFFAKASYGDFTFQGGYVGRKKRIPTASFGTIFNNGRDATVDNRGYLDLKYQHEFANQLTVKGRLYYDRYYYRSDYLVDIPVNPLPTLNNDFVTTDQAGGELMLVKRLFEKHKVTLGSEFRSQFRMDQANKDAEPPTTYVDDKRKATIWALYLQDEFAITDRLILNAGFRYDHYSTFGGTVNPRAGLIYTWRDTTAKLLYGRAFRAPNPFEQFYAGAGAKANPDLKPETITTYELVLEQYLGHHLRGSASGYYYEIDKLISQVEDPSDGLLVYQNGNKVNAKGLELALEGKWSSGWEGRLSYAIQEARDNATDSVLTNSPQHLAKGNLIIPLFRDKVFAGLESRYMSSRLTLGGNQAKNVFLTNVTLFTQQLLPGWEFSAQLNNLFDHRYGDPASGEHPQDTILQDGRTYWLKLKYHF
jgi:outer membrane receptor for ferrienterochelin and colicins